MKSSTSNIVKSVGIGMLIGGAGAIIGNSMTGTKMNYKKTLKKAIKSAEQILDSMM